MTALHAAEHEEWVSLHAAAARLRLSIDTVRRRVKDGTFPARKVPSRYGPAWQVRMDEVVRLVPAVAAPAEQSPAAMADMLHLIGDLHDRVTALAERNGVLRAQLEQAETLLRTRGIHWDARGVNGAD